MQHGSQGKGRRRGKRQAGGTGSHPRQTRRHMTPHLGSGVNVPYGDERAEAVHRDVGVSLQRLVCPEISGVGQDPYPERPVL